jgi:hypothetical protein
MTNAKPASAVGDTREQPQAGGHFHDVLHPSWRRSEHDERMEDEEKA